MSDKMQNIKYLDRSVVRIEDSDLIDLSLDVVLCVYCP